METPFEVKWSFAPLQSPYDQISCRRRGRMTRLRIVSGGQTGVDRAALDAALALDIPCGGWCPAGRRAEDGRIDARYPLTETASAAYSERTLANVRDSDATLILGCDQSGTTSSGTALTAKAAADLGRPLFVATVFTGVGGDACHSEICAWIVAHRISVLNIAGPRESECPGIYDAAYALILNLLTAVIPR